MLSFPPHHPCVLFCFWYLFIPFLSCTITKSITLVRSSILISVLPVYLAIVKSSCLPFFCLYIACPIALVVISAEVMNVSCSSPRHVDFAVRTRKNFKEVYAIFPPSSPICPYFGINRIHEFSCYRSQSTPAKRFFS